MAPKRDPQASKKGGQGSDSEEEADPMLAMLASFQQQQKLLAQQLMDQQKERQAERQALQAQIDRQQQALTQSLADIATRLGGAGAGGGGAGAVPPAAAGAAAGGTRAKKIEIPCLRHPKDVTLADWRDWRERFQGYASVQKLRQECDIEGRRCILKSALDPGWTKLWAGRSLEIEGADDIEEIMMKIGAYLRRQRNPLIDRQDLHNRNQLPDENVDQYLAALQVMYDSCDYEDDRACDLCGEDCGHGARLREMRLRDRLVIGLRDEQIQKDVLKESLEDLTLEKTLKICRAGEASKATQGQLQQEEVVEIDQVEKNKGGYRRKSTYKKEKFTRATGGKEATDEACRNCGFTHEKGSCPAFGKKCNFCGKENHFEAVCLKKKSSTEKVMNTVFVSQVTEEQRCRTVRLKSTIEGAERDLDWVPDTGAEVSVMGEQHLRQFGEIQVREADITVRDFTRETSGLQGKVQATLKLGNRTCDCDVYVVKDVPRPLLGMEGLVKLGFISEDWPSAAVRAISIGPLETRAEVKMETGENSRAKAGRVRNRARARHDRGTRAWPMLRAGDKVQVQHCTTRRWDLIGEVLKDETRSGCYLVRSEKGCLYWRNRRFVRLHDIRKERDRHGGKSKGASCHDA